MLKYQKVPSIASWSNKPANFNLGWAGSMSRQRNSQKGVVVICCHSLDLLIRHLIFEVRIPINAQVYPDHVKISDNLINCFLQEFKNSDTFRIFKILTLSGFLKF